MTGVTHTCAARHTGRGQRLTLQQVQPFFFVSPVLPGLPSGQLQAVRFDVAPVLNFMDSRPVAQLVRALP